MRKPTKEEMLAANNKVVQDVIAPDLKIVFCGINPGLYTAAVGYHFARPGNRFWPTLYGAGFTPRLLKPNEQQSLIDLGIGITNVVPRASLAASELSKTEIRKGGEALVKKMAKFQPQWLAILGITTYRTAFSLPKATIGKQAMIIGRTKVWVLPNPSGLNAHYKPQDFIQLFSELRQQLS